MLKNFLTELTSLPLVQKGLNAYALREKVISSNIANAATPGYRRMEVEFEDKFKQVLNANAAEVKLTNPKHIPISTTNDAEPQILTDGSDDLASGVNNVNVEEEMVDLVKNQIRYMYATRMASRDFTAIRAAIKGRYDR